MGDIAQILAPTAAAAPVPNGTDGSFGTNKAVGMAGISKEVMDLLGGNQDRASASLPPMVPTFPQQTYGSKISSSGGEKDSDGSTTHQQNEVTIKVGNKLISSSKRARPWAWAPFASSGRTDGAMFRHWVRKNVEYTDYPYAKFDIHMDPVTYSSNEYETHLQSETWTRSETDRLMELARTHECRWTVIFDRFCFNDVSSARKIEDLQHRYYGVAATLSQTRIIREAAIEARTLSAAAAKAYTASLVTNTTTATTATTTTNAVNVAAKTPSLLVGASSTVTVAAPIDDAQEKTEAILLESAAARALATSAKQHQPLITHVGSGTSNKMFDFVRERERRQHLDRLWKRSKEDEAEELHLRKELKTIEAQLRKLKKNGGHILAAGTTTTKGTKNITPTSSGLPNQLSNASSSRTPSRSATPVPPGTSVQIEADLQNNDDIVESSQVLDEYFASTAPVPMPQFPYLQSGRLVGPSGMNKSLLTRMDQVLGEFNIPTRPMPTKRVCDMYDSVRKDILTLVTLQKMVMQREGQLQSKRLRLTRLGGTMIAPQDKVLDEERLLGIAPPPKPAAATGNSTASKGRATKRKAVAGGAGTKSKATKKGNTDSKNTGSTTTTKKKIVKRKRKTDTSKSPIPAANIAGASKSASKVRTTTAGAAVPKSTTAPKSTTPAAPTGISPKVLAGSSLKAPSTVPAVTNKPSSGSTKKRARKS
jgi:DNA methyltransferase 1-associated protein 1